MNLESTQKMNSMLQELTKHGHVSIFGDDPLQFAKEIYADALPDSEKRPVFDSGCSRGASTSESESVSKSKDSEPKAEYGFTPSRDYVNEGHVKFLIEQKLEAYKAHVNAIVASKMDRFYEEMSSLRSQIKDLKSQQGAGSQNVGFAQQVLSAPAVSQPVQESNVQNTAPSPVQQSQSQGGTSHPRNGNFQPNDVAIDKIFYSGTR